MLTKTQVIDLKIYAAQIRREAIRAISHAPGGGHIGGAMSMADALAVLYGKQMNVDPGNPRMEERDRFVLSKGHAGPSLYAALALRGFFPVEELMTMNRPGTRLPSHCDRNKTPGIDFSTGSLGQGLSMAAGSALAARVLGKDYTTYCMVGDGECDEGQIWESALFCGHHKVDRLIAFVDCNQQQLDGYTRDVCRLGDLKEKFGLFGWFCQEVNGHDISAIDGAVEAAKARGGQPSMIILNTVKGMDCRFAQERGLCHHMAIPEDVCGAEVERLDREIAALRAQREEC